LTLKGRIKMAVTCVLLLLLLSNESVSGWLTWYASTRHDPSTTPRTNDSNELGHQTDSTRIPGMFPITCPFVLVNAVSAQYTDSSAAP
jgi:hypothetical protein